jgi:hypothetical protein
MERHDSTIHVQWDPPYDGSYKFNVDDSYNKRNASSTLVVDRDEHLGQSKITVHNQSISICYNWTLKPNVITGYKTGYIHNHFYNRFLLLKTGFWFNNWFFFPKNK